GLRAPTQRAKLSATEPSLNWSAAGTTPGSQIRKICHESPIPAVHFTLCGCRLCPAITFATVRRGVSPSPGGRGVSPGPPNIVCQYDERFRRDIRWCCYGGRQRRGSFGGRRGWSRKLRKLWCSTGVDHLQRSRTAPGARCYVPRLRDAARRIDNADRPRPQV